jgi:hypothetical protein
VKREKGHLTRWQNYGLTLFLTGSPEQFDISADLCVNAPNDQSKSGLNAKRNPLFSEIQRQRCGSELETGYRRQDHTTMSTQDAENNVVEKSNDELLAMLAHPDDWQPDMLGAARAQLQRRGVAFSTAVTHREGTPAAFEKPISLTELKAALELKLGSGYRYTVKKYSLVIVQDGVRGCIVTLKPKNGKTVISGPCAFMPSGGLRAVVIVGTLVLLFLVGLSMGVLIVGVGLVQFLILLAIFKLPSRNLVKQVGQLLEEISKDLMPEA